jgi:hypothetical protein
VFDYICVPFLENVLCCLKKYSSDTIKTLIADIKTKAVLRGLLLSKINFKCTLDQVCNYCVYVV